MIAERFELTREELDAFALESHLRAAAATDEGPLRGGDPAGPRRA